ncbi:MAG: PPC domain-containing protein [Isosphaeraceae bacterium]|nr:PPC domain-containing protein [Isosphaeraceae bacterium]
MGVLTLTLAPALRAQTGYPMITRVQPTAVQRGQSVEVTIAGAQNFAGASALLFEGTGLSGEVLEAQATGNAASKGRGATTGTVRARLSVAPDAALGPREFRVVTPQGVSSVGQVVVVADPVVAEADDKANDLPTSAQSIALPAVVSGTVGKVEDVDWYAFTVEAGRRVTFSLWGNRLEDKIHDLQMHLDPILVLYDAQGRELAANDNRDFADPMLSYEFPEAGTYLIQVRDTTYAGNPNWTYVLLATAGPYATSVFPLAVNPGTTVDLHAQGYNFDPSQPIRLDVPKDAKAGPAALPLLTAQGPTPPVPLAVTELPLAVEREDAPAEPDKAQPLEGRVALSGQLGEPNDIDVYRFEAKKGRTYTLEVMARRVGSEADPVLRVVNPKGTTLAEADDTFGKDPRLEWKATADGPVAVQVSDLHSRGGEGFGYVLLAQEAEPDFTLTCDPDKLNFGPGTRTPVFVKLTRQAGFNGPVTLQWSGLPPGVSASPLTISPQMSQGVIVLSAAPDAPKGGMLVTLTGRAETERGTLIRPVVPTEEIYLPGGGRGLYQVETLAVGVTDPSDIQVEAQPTEITLKPGGTATIDVSVTRREGFDKPVNLALDLAHLGRVFASALPPGVTMRPAGSKTLLGPKENAGKIILQAAPTATPIEGVPITVMGHVSINFVVKTAYCSAPIKLTVAKP